MRLHRRHFCDTMLSLPDSPRSPELKDEDEFIGDFLDKLLILFTCLNITEEELQRVAHLWNTHIIRKNQKCHCSKWPTSHDVHTSSAVWRPRSSQTCIRAGSASVQSTMLTTGALSVRRNCVHVVLSVDGRPLSTCPIYTQ
ncbi:hypothetical protein WMY93_000696 [Mugilogobius chulae]|uniref:Uncharacterized protein n=1 Tax=Mugilogobius chulae TaxID=88201 RepID=A0AAW0Q1L5_9GOBI